MRLWFSSVVRWLIYLSVTEFALKKPKNEKMDVKLKLNIRFHLNKLYFFVNI